MNSDPTQYGDEEEPDIWETKRELAWLEEKQAGTTDKDEKKSIENSIKIAQKAHKKAILRGASKKKNDTTGGNNGVEQTPIDVDIDEPMEDCENNETMREVLGKRGNNEEKETTEKGKKSKGADENNWKIAPSGGCNGNGGQKGRGRGSPTNQTTTGGDSNNVGETRRLKDYLVAVLPPIETAQANNITQSQKGEEGNNAEQNNKEKQQMITNPYINYSEAAQNEPILGRIVKTTNKIRVRFSFKGNQSDPSEIGFGEEMKRVLNEYIKTLKEVDNAGRILTWENQEGEEMGIGKQDMSKMSPKGANKYLDIPTYIKSFGTRKNSRIGIRVATNMDLREFVETWSSMKPKGQADWMTVFPSEMQTSPTAHAVGFLQGSSEKKVTTTINRTLQTELNCKAEISWQYMKQNGVTEYLWDKANEYAEKKVGKKGTQFNRIKFSMGPSALIVYVANKEDVKIARKTLLEVYGKEFEQKWPQWSDGSRMKFVPLIGGEIQNERAREQITTRIKWQIHSKANEVTLELPMHDIHKHQIYLNNQSMESIILGTMTEKDKNIPLFKHITYKYTRNPAETKYQITVYKAMEGEAIKWLEEMKDTMHSQFGNEVFQHFEDKHKGLMESHYKRRTNKQEDYDEETENWLAESHTTEKEGILEPGFIAFLSSEGIKGSDSTIHDIQTKKSNDSDNSNASANTAVSAISGISGYSTLSTVSWVQLPVEKDSTDWRNTHQASIRVQQKLDKAQITSRQLEEWTAKNSATMTTLNAANEDNIYKTMKQVIILITKERTRYREDQQQQTGTGAAAAGPPGI